MARTAGQSPSGVRAGYMQRGYCVLQLCCGSVGRRYVVSGPVCLVPCPDYVVWPELQCVDRADWGYPDPLS